MRNRINCGLFAALGLVLLTGCPSESGGGAEGKGVALPPPASSPDAPKPETPTGTTQGAPAPVESALGVLSNDGAFYVTYAFDPDPLPLNEVYGMTVTVYDGKDRTRRLDDVELEVDGRMPMHRHGMNREPQVKRDADGSFAVTGMLFHMPGAWEMHFDVTQHGITERAQVAIDLE